MTALLKPLLVLCQRSLPSGRPLSYFLSSIQKFPERQVWRLAESIPTTKGRSDVRFYFHVLRNVLVGRAFELSKGLRSAPAFILVLALLALRNAFATCRRIFAVDVATVTVQAKPLLLFGILNCAHGV